MNLIANAFTENLGTDFVAISPNGTPVGRAPTREALEQAHANTDGGVTILDAAGVAAAQPTLAEAATAALDGPFAAVVAQGVDGGKVKPSDEAVATAGQTPDPFDHDFKSGPGGSLKGEQSTAHKGAEAKKAKAAKNV
jgi:hypothetical protein